MIGFEASRKCSLRIGSGIQRLLDAAEDREEYDSVENLSDLDCITQSLRDAAQEFMRHRMSWKDLGIAIEKAIEDLESEAEEEGKYTGESQDLLHRALQLATNALATIDSGNRTEAEAAADRTAGRQ